MKKHLIYLTTAIIAMAMIFTACEREEYGEVLPPAETDSYEDEDMSIITATNVLYGNSSIATVKFLLYYYADEDSYSEAGVIATGKYENDGFKLTLPDIIDSKYFVNHSLADYFGLEEKCISDNKARMTEWGGVSIDAYDKAGNEIGWFNYEGEGDIWCFYVYVDRDLTIKGSSAYSGIFDCTFKKGWNIIYHYGRHTTKKPANMTFRWYFDTYQN